MASSRPKKTISQHRAFVLGCLLILGFIGVGIAAVAIIIGSLSPSTPAPPSPQRTKNPIEALLQSTAPGERRDGVAAMLLVDVSGSMNDEVPDADGRLRRKIEIAQRCIANIVRQAEGFAQAHPDKQLFLGVDEFSTRDHQPSCRNVVPLGPPKSAIAERAVARMIPGGGTPIGDAIIEAKRQLDSSQFRRLHILVVTDGMNNRGYRPEDVTEAMSRVPEEYRASLYFVAFDVSARVFDTVKSAGALVLGAANERELQQTLDYVLTGKILAELPGGSAPK